MRDKLLKTNNWKLSIHEPKKWVELLSISAFGYGKPSALIGFPKPVIDSVWLIHTLCGPLLENIWSMSLDSKQNGMLCVIRWHFTRIQKFFFFFNVMHVRHRCLFQTHKLVDMVDGLVRSVWVCWLKFGRLHPVRAVRWLYFWKEDVFFNWFSVVASSSVLWEVSPFFFPLDWFAGKHRRGDSWLDGTFSAQTSFEAD